jgi:ABC-type multidrug transport system ATPase subunit
MQKGEIIVEGTPGQLRNLLNQRVLELRGAPLPLLKTISAQNADVEDVRAFGDRLHLRVKTGQSASVISALEQAIPSGGGNFLGARSIPSSLEDVFIYLSEREHEPA